MKRNILIPIFAFLWAISFSSLSWAQENKTIPLPAGSEAPAAKPVPTEWLYGEINSVDVSAKTLSLTYLDYDTDIEKQATVYLDSKTVFENVKSLEEIKAQDMVSIDYVVGADSRSLAVSISVEKPESLDDLDIEGAAPDEPKHQMKPAVEDPAFPSVADPGAGPAKTQ